MGYLSRKGRGPGDLNGCSAHAKFALTATAICVAPSILHLERSAHTVPPSCGGGEVTPCFGKSSAHKKLAAAPALGNRWNFLPISSMLRKGGFLLDETEMIERKDTYRAALIWSKVIPHPGLGALGSRTMQTVLHLCCIGFFSLHVSTCRKLSRSTKKSVKQGWRPIR